MNFTTLFWSCILFYIFVVSSCVLHTFHRRLCYLSSDSTVISASEMTCIVSSGALNSTHSLIHPAAEWHACFTSNQLLTYLLTIYLLW